MSPQNKSQSVDWSMWQILAVWQKARIVPGVDPAVMRKDAGGAWIRLAEYGKETHCGWQVDHIVPRAKGGGHQLANLQPLHYLNNRSKGDDYPRWRYSVTAK